MRFTANIIAFFTKLLRHFLDVFVALKRGSLSKRLGQKTGSCTKKSRYFFTTLVRQNWIFLLRRLDSFNLK